MAEPAVNDFATIAARVKQLAEEQQKNDPLRCEHNFVGVRCEKCGIRTDDVILGDAAVG